MHTRWFTDLMLLYRLGCHSLIRLESLKDPLVFKAHNPFDNELGILTQNNTGSGCRWAHPIPLIRQALSQPFFDCNLLACSHWRALASQALVMKSTMEYQQPPMALHHQQKSNTLVLRWDQAYAYVVQDSLLPVAWCSQRHQLIVVMQSRHLLSNHRFDHQRRVLQCSCPERQRILFQSHQLSNPNVELSPRPDEPSWLHEIRSRLKVRQCSARTASIFHSSLGVRKCPKITLLLLSPFGCKDCSGVKMQRTLRLPGHCNCIGHRFGSDFAFSCFSIIF